MTDTQKTDSDSGHTDDTEAVDLHDELAKVIREAKAAIAGRKEKELTIDALAELDTDDKNLNPESRHTGVSWERAVNALPDDAKKLLGNLRKDYTQKTQAHAADRKRLQELQSQVDALLNQKTADELRKTAETKVEIDEFSPESIERLAEQKAAASLEKMLAPMRQEAQEQLRKAKVQEFISSHSDFNELKVDIAKRLGENPALSLQDAYKLVRADKLESEYESTRSELDLHKKAAKDAGLKIGGGSRGTSSNKCPPEVVRQGPVAILEWVKSNKG